MRVFISLANHGGSTFARKHPATPGSPHVPHDATQRLSTVRRAPRNDRQACRHALQQTPPNWKHNQSAIRTRGCTSVWPPACVQSDTSRSTERHTHQSCCRTVNDTLRRGMSTTLHHPPPLARLLLVPAPPPTPAPPPLSPGRHGQLLLAFTPRRGGSVRPSLPQAEGLGGSQPSVLVAMPQGFQQAPSALDQHHEPLSRHRVRGGCLIYLFRWRIFVRALRERAEGGGDVCAGASECLRVRQSGLGGSVPAGRVGSPIGGRRRPRIRQQKKNRGSPSIYRGGPRGLADECDVLSPLAFPQPRTWRGLGMCVLHCHKRAL